MTHRRCGRLIRLLAIGLLGLGAGCNLAYADDSSSNGLESDPRLLAKLAKVKAKQSQQQSKDGGDQTANCGGVDIGNINTPQPIGAPREITVIITGDVINANNKCK